MLQDQFDPQPENRTVLDPVRFANPADKTYLGYTTVRTNPNSHLKLYKLSPKLGHIRKVDVTNQLSPRPQPLHVRDSTLLAVPTQKNGIGVVHDLDHFKCYECDGNPVNVFVDLTDQFHVEMGVAVLRPRYLCNPVVKVHNNIITPILYPLAHLVFYEIVGQPFVGNVTTHNQFGDEALPINPADLLGVPSVKSNIVEITGAFSQKSHGAAGNFNVDLPLTGTPGIEDRSGGATNDFTVTAVFSENVAVTGSPQAQVTSGTGTVGSGGISNGGVVTVTANNVTIQLTNVADQQTINVTLNGVTSASLSGTSPNTCVIPMSRLLGDTNGNGAVNSTDVSQTKTRTGITATSANFRSDVNASGVINSTDLSQVKGNSGHALP